MLWDLFTSERFACDDFNRASKLPTSCDASKPTLPEAAATAAELPLPLQLLLIATSGFRGTTAMCAVLPTRVGIALLPGLALVVVILLVPFSFFGTASTWLGLLPKRPWNKNIPALSTPR